MSLRAILAAPASEQPRLARDAAAALALLDAWLTLHPHAEDITGNGTELASALRGRHPALPAQAMAEVLLTLLHVLTDVGGRAHCGGCGRLVFCDALGAAAVALASPETERIEAP